MSKVTPFLWFDTQAEEAMNFYVSLFKNSKVNNVSRGPDGKAFTVSFELDGREFMGLNAGPHYKFNEAISLYVDCKDQAEVDYFWNKFIAEGGEESMCGWLKDKYGLSWQVNATSEKMAKIMNDPKRSGKAMIALMQMRKLDLAILENA